QQGGRDELPAVAEIEPLVVLLLREPSRGELEDRRRVERQELHVWARRAAEGARPAFPRAEYAARSFGAPWRHSSSPSTPLRPHAPIRARSAGSSRSRRIFAARSAGSFFLAYSDASPAERRPSVRSNCTIGLPRAMYSMILFIVDLSFSSFATSGLTQTSAV